MISLSSLPASPRRSSDRRAWMLGAGLALAGGLGAIAGCGFQLRQPPELRLKRVQLRGFDRYSAMGDELRRQLRQSPGVQLVEAAPQADLVVEALSDRTDQVATALTAAGQVRELTLRVKMTFRVLSSAGVELQAPADLSQTRQLSYAENAALAKEHEIKLLLREMHGDMALQVLRRLATLSPAEVAASAASAAATAGAASAVTPAASR